MKCRSKCASCGSSTARMMAFRAFLVMGLILQLGIGIIITVATSQLLIKFGYLKLAQKLNQLANSIAIAQSGSVVILLGISCKQFYCFVSLTDLIHLIAIGIWFLWRLRYTRYTDSGRLRTIQLTILVAIAVLLSLLDFMMDANSVGLFRWTVILFQNYSSHPASNAAYAALFTDGLLFFLATMRVLFVFFAFLPFLTAYVKRDSCQQEGLLSESANEDTSSSNEEVAPPQSVRSPRVNYDATMY
ncbi:hypothetical protein BDF19DRAFT_266971 [Syncephalis fuscata]|nr:hypothetical protein BDF19DRAFT_266971 [Syncephalis fuscata]